MTRVQFIVSQPLQNNSARAAVYAAVYWRDGDSVRTDQSLQGVEGELIEVIAPGSDCPMAVVLLRCDSEWYVTINGVHRVTYLVVPLHNIARATT